MKRYEKLLVLALACFALLLFMTANQGMAEEKKLTVLTWNIPYFEEGFNEWVTAFNKIHPDITIERLDKKGSEWSTFYQTQVVAGTAPDIIDVQGGLWLEYASKGGLLDITDYLKRDQDYTERIYPEILERVIVRRLENLHQRI